MPDLDGGPLPNTSIKTLTYSEGPAHSFGHLTNGVRNSTSYANSNNLAIRQLTAIFSGISNSIEFGRQIEDLRHGDQAALDGALKLAEDRANKHQLIEIGIIAQSLKEVADDPSVSNTARGRARHLLLLAGSSQ